VSNQPKAVLISDIHFTVSTLDLAAASLIAASKRSVELNVPLIIAGDTLDSKAIIRAECANKLMDILCRYPAQIIVGNHDLINEKGKEHSLEFLRAYGNIIDMPLRWHEDLFLMPYMSSKDEFLSALEEIPSGSTIICHQGIMGADMGHYVQDKTSLPTETFANFRVISGHYHRAQDIKTGRPRKGAVGLFSYIGNPYTLSFGEAKDGPKGYQILHENGLLTQVPLNLRKHVIIERDINRLFLPTENINKDDLIWLKVTGPYIELERLNKKEVGERLFGHSNFKLDKIYSDVPLIVNSDNSTGEQIMDKLIDASDEKAEEKQELKKLWRGLI